MTTATATAAESKVNGSQPQTEIAKQAAPAARPVARLVVEDSSSFSSILDTARYAQVWEVAQCFAASTLVPKQFQGSAPNCFIAMQMAIRMNIDPFMFMQNTYIVHGKPGMEAKLAIALMNRSGLFKDAIDFEIEGSDDPFDDEYRVRAYATKTSTGKKLEGPWIDWKLVRGEGWHSKEGSKWKTMPGMMFMYRAATFFGRMFCPECLMGMMTADELDDTGPDRKPVDNTARGTTALLTRIEHGEPGLSGREDGGHLTAIGRPDDSRTAADDDAKDRPHGEDVRTVSAEEPTNAKPARKTKAAETKPATTTAGKLPEDRLTTSLAKGVFIELCKLFQEKLGETCSPEEARAQLIGWLGGEGKEVSDLDTKPGRDDIKALIEKVDWERFA